MKHFYIYDDAEENHVIAIRIKFALELFHDESKIMQEHRKNLPDSDYSLLLNHAEKLYESFSKEIAVTLTKDGNMILQNVLEISSLFWDSFIRVSNKIIEIDDEKEK